MKEMFEAEVRVEVWKIIKKANHFPTDMEWAGTSKDRVKEARKLAKEALELPIEQLLSPSQIFIDLMRQAAEKLRAAQFTKNGAYFRVPCSELEELKKNLVIIYEGDLPF